MSGEKTEQPSEKRLRDARRKGQVAKSQDLSSSLLLVIAVSTLWLSGTHVSSWLSEAMTGQLNFAASFNGELTEDVALGVLFDGVKTLALVLAPLLAVLVLFGVLVNYLQVGSLFSFESMKPDPNKLNPTEGFKNKFLKARPYLELGKTVLKIVVTVAVVWSVLWGARFRVIELTSQPVTGASSLVASLVFEIGLKVGLAFLIVGAADYFLQRFLHRKELKMTKQEVKEEYKESEGDPLMKQMRKQLHREVMMQSMMMAVKRANVVVVNPTHLAVAIRYERGGAGAPVVVAKGAELMAARIRELAEEASVPVTRDVPLARSLYELEIDEEVPEVLYEAVAVVLRWAYENAEERGEVGAN